MITLSDIVSAKIDADREAKVWLDAESVMHDRSARAEDRSNAVITRDEAKDRWHALERRFQDVLAQAVREAMGEVQLLEVRRG